MYFTIIEKERKTYDYFKRSFQGKEFDKIPYPFMIKTVKKQE